MKHNISKDNRSISETIATILLIAAIILSAITAYGIGTSIIQERASSSQIDGVEKGFILLDQNIESHENSAVPERLIRLGISKGELSIKDTTTITITVGSSDYTYNSHRISYKNGQKEITYDSGYIIRSSNNGQVVTNTIDIQSKREILHVSIPVLSGDGSLKPSRSAAIRTTLTNSETRLLSSTGKDVSITITSPHADTLSDSLSEKDGFSCSTPSSDTVSCDINNIKNVQIQATYIDVRLDY
jgi:hypothetical protein